MNEKCIVACEPAKSRIIKIYEQLQELGSEVFQLQRVVNENRNKYFGSPGVSNEADKEESKGGTVNDIEWMISDIKRMVLDVREYVEIL